MERGVYFDAWFPRQHCYHPSLPPRRLRMVDDLVDYRATVLVWAALGGGSMSLPYLEQEAFGDGRRRGSGSTGSSTTAEFIAELPRARDRGLRHRVRGAGLGVPGRAQRGRGRGPVAQRDCAGSASADWLGLREFSPEPLSEAVAAASSTTSRTAWSTATASRSPTSSRSAARATSTAGPATRTGSSAPTASTSATTWTATTRSGASTSRRSSGSRSTPAWTASSSTRPSCRSTPLQYGGCFCKDCMRGFRAYLQALPADELPANAAGADLDTFHYGEWLLEQGYDFKSNREATPLFWRLPAFPARDHRRLFRRARGLRPRVRGERGPRGAGLRQLLQPVRPLLPRWSRRST